MMDGGISLDDFSDEALEADLVDDQYDAPAANEEEVDEAPVAHHAEVEATPGDEEPVTPEGETPTDDTEREDQGENEPETPASVPSGNEVDWQERHRNAEELIGRQGTELAQLRAQIAAIQAAQQQPQVQQPQPQYGFQPESMDDLLDLAVESPEAAFEWTMQNDPQLMPAVIAEVRAHDPAKAEEMVLSYSMMANEAIVEQRIKAIEQKFEQRTQPIVRMQAQAENAGAVDAVAQQYPDWNEHREAVANLIQTEGKTLFKGSTPQHIQEGVNLAYWKAKAARSDALIKAQQMQAEALQAQSDDATVVTEGTTVAKPQKADKSIEDEIADGIMEANQKLVW